MTEEEKKAIEYLKKYINWETYGERSLEKDIQTVLNLIKKQQAEMEKLKNKNNDLLRKLRNRVKDVKKLKKYSTYKKEFSRLNKKIEEYRQVSNEDWAERCRLSFECDELREKLNNYKNKIVIDIDNSKMQVPVDFHNYNSSDMKEICELRDKLIRKIKLCKQ